MKSPKKFLIIAAVLQIVWGLVPSASKYVIDEIPVELYVVIRWTISGTIFGYILFQEPLRPLMLLGGSLILAGMITGNLPQNVTEKKSNSGMN